MDVSGARSRSGVSERIGNVLSPPLPLTRPSVRIKAGGSCHSVPSIPTLNPIPVPPPPKEPWNSTFRSTHPGVWAAQSRSSQSAPTFPPPQQLPPQPPTRTSRSQPRFIRLSNLSFTATKQTDKAVANVRQKKNAVRGKGGLVHGTGRVKPNGTIRRSDSNSSKKSASEPAPLEPSKQRLVIEQGPTPLYCSDECRLADLNLPWHR
jgi:hypothetical protein